MKKNSKSVIIDKSFNGIIFAIFAMLSVLILLPLFWVIYTSLNDLYNYMMNPLALPKELQFENYVRAFNGLYISVWDNENARIIEYTIYNMFGFSVIISTVASLMGVLASALLAYATAKYKFKGSELLVAVNLFVMTLPIYGALPSQLVIFKALNLYDNLIPYLLVGHTGMGMQFLIFRGSFRGMPNEYKEAASLDGAGHFTIMTIYFRLLMPLFVAYFMLGFVGNWNNYMNCVIWLPSYPNLSYGIYVFREFGTIQGFTTPEMLAGFVIVAIPSVLLWTISQRFVGDRIVAGSLKG